MIWIGALLLIAVLAVDELIGLADLDSIGPTSGAKWDDK
jgi:hypothetical protein